MFVNTKKFYTRESMKAVFFGYVNALRFNMVNSSIERCALNFMKHHRLTEETFNMESAIREYHRMAAEYIETEKTDEKQK